MARLLSLRSLIRDTDNPLINKYPTGMGPRAVQSLQMPHHWVSNLGVLRWRFHRCFLPHQALLCRCLFPFPTLKLVLLSPKLLPERRRTHRQSLKGKPDWFTMMLTLVR